MSKRIKQLLKLEANTLQEKMRKLSELDNVHAKELYNLLTSKYLNVYNFNLARITHNKRVYRLSFTVGGFNTVVKKGKVKAFYERWDLSSVGTFEHLLKEIDDGYIDDIIQASEPNKSVKIPKSLINDSFKALGLKLYSDEVKDE